MPLKQPETPAPPNHPNTPTPLTTAPLLQPCYALASLAEFRALGGGGPYAAAQVIAVDEAQFFPDLVDFAARAADEDGKAVLLAGLDGDFRRRRFGQVLDLVPLADADTTLPARCMYCAAVGAAAAAAAAGGSGSRAGAGAPAVFSLRIDTLDQRQEVVGGAEQYAPVCRRHYVSLTAAAAVAAAGGGAGGES